jgi:hypothetical protein
MDNNMSLRLSTAAKARQVVPNAPSRTKTGSLHHIPSS